MSDFIIKDGVLEKYTGAGGKVVIPEGVTKIGKGAMCSFKPNNVKSVVIPEGVQYIGDSAFRNCTTLKEIIIPNSVRNIGDMAFLDCKALKEIVLPDSVEKVGEFAFRGCTQLQKVQWPQTCIIGDGALWGVKKLANENGFAIIDGVLWGYYGKENPLVIPDGVVAIDSWAFANNNKYRETVTEVVIPPSVKAIGKGTFQGFKKLANGDGFVIIQNILFDYYGRSKAVKIPDHVHTIGASAFAWDFYGNLNPIHSVTLSSNIVAIGNSAFYSCNLTEVTLPSSLQQLGKNAFACCEKLKKIQLPDALDTIPASCFKSCKALRRITIPVGVKRIEDYAFAESAIEQIHLSENVAEISERAWGDSIPSTLVIHAPAGSYAEEYARKMGISFVSVRKSTPAKTQNSRIDTAFDAFKKQVDELDGLLLDLGYEKEPYPGVDDYLHTEVTASSSPNDANAFFALVEKHLETNGLGLDKNCDLSAKQIAQQCNKDFQNIITACQNGDSISPTATPIRACVAVGLACYYFLSNETRMEVEWNRDKWESAGDYCSAEKVAYSISANGGNILVKKHKSYSNFD